MFSVFVWLLIVAKSSSIGRPCLRQQVYLNINMAKQTITNWGEQLRPESIFAKASEAAVQWYTNYLGCAIGGFGHENTEVLLQATTSLSQAPETSSLLGSDIRADPFQAALIDAFAAHPHHYDDTHLETVIPLTAAVASALLAYVDSVAGGGKQTYGRDFVRALVATVEIESLLGKPVYLSQYDVGWQVTGSVGLIGAALAVKAMNLFAEKSIHAIGLASVHVSGMRLHFWIARQADGSRFSRISWISGCCVGNRRNDSCRRWVG
jgi:aconitate decarboxylase